MRMLNSGNIKTLMQWVRERSSPLLGTSVRGKIYIAKTGVKNVTHTDSTHM